VKNVPKYTVTDGFLYILVDRGVFLYAFFGVKILVVEPLKKVTVFKIKKQFRGGKEKI
jgi:hypothetical protein